LNSSAYKSNKKNQKSLSNFNTSDTICNSEYRLYNLFGQLLLKGNELFHIDLLWKLVFKIMKKSYSSNKISAFIEIILGLTI
jgi:hypothetical protein